MDYSLGYQNFDQGRICSKIVLLKRHLIVSNFSKYQQSETFHSGTVNTDPKNRQNFLRKSNGGNGSGYTDQTEIQIDTKPWIQIALHFLHEIE